VHFVTKASFILLKSAQKDESFDTRHDLQYIGNKNVQPPYFLKLFIVSLKLPGDLALSCNPSYLGGQSSVGWFEVERPPQENRRAFGTALWLPASRYRHDDARGSMTKQACKKPPLKHSCNGRGSSLRTPSN
jgi:hypothetical protein